jgi:hypothetical protein
VWRRFFVMAGLSRPKDCVALAGAPELNRRMGCGCAGEGELRFVLTVLAALAAFFLRDALSKVMQWTV